MVLNVSEQGETAMEENGQEAQRTESTSEPGLHCCAKFTPPALVAHPVPQFRTGFILHQALDLNRIGYRAPVYVVAPGSVVGSQAAGSVATTRPSETPRGPREVVEGGIRYVMTPKGDQCLVNRPNVWNGEELCECRSDGCRDCDDRLSTVAQKEDDENASSIADESVLSTHAASPVDDQSIRSENDGSLDDSASSQVLMHRRSRNLSQQSQASSNPPWPTGDEGVGSSKVVASGRNAVAAAKVPVKTELADDASLSLSVGMSKFSSLAGNLTEDPDLLCLLRAMENDSPCELAGGSDLTHAGSLDQLLESGSKGEDKSTLSCFDDDEDGDNGKKVLRNAADEEVVQKLFNTTTVDREKVMHIASMPVHELNKLMQNANVTEPQASLIRDIRRRGKNKIAARNCRKRKLETITELEADVNALVEKRKRMEVERDRLRVDAERYKKCMHHLRRFVMKSLQPSRRTSSLSASNSSLDLMSSFSAPSNNALPSTTFSHSQSLDSSTFSVCSMNSLPNASMSLPPPRNENFDLPHPRPADIVTGLQAVNQYASSVHSSLTDIASQSTGSQHDDAASLARQTQLGINSSMSSQQPMASQAQMAINSNQGLSAAVSAYGQINPGGQLVPGPFPIYAQTTAGGVLNFPIAAAPPGWTQSPSLWSGFPTQPQY